MTEVLVSAKVSVFLQQDHKDFTQVFPKVLLGTNTNSNNKNTSKQWLYELFITKQEQKAWN